MLARACEADAPPAGARRLLQARRLVRTVTANGQEAVDTFHERCPADDAAG